MPKETHKKIAEKLLSLICGEPKVVIVIYENNAGKNRVAIGEYGKKGAREYSTKGLFEKKFVISVGII